jgi:hypothetical protein
MRPNPSIVGGGPEKLQLWSRMLTRESGLKDAIDQTAVTFPNDQAKALAARLEYLRFSPNCWRINGPLQQPT